MQNRLVQSTELQDADGTLVISLKVEAHLDDSVDDSLKAERQLINKARQAFSALIKEANNHVKE